ncbi:5-formyltetrahydrofolate cyclo-ligase [Phlebopus sp. FC_14]|nr:5-formyltetrahydrofolate cyclo-ligase [Phlebopus sp. FC_14]
MQPSHRIGLLHHDQVLLQTSIMTLQTNNKRALRKAVTATLNDLSLADVQAQSEAIASKILALPAFQSCKAISCYLSMPTAEVQTTAVIMSILADSGKRLSVPSIAAKDGYMDFVRLHDVNDLQSMPLGLWGIPQPTLEWQNEKRQSILDSSCDNLDVILMPGVAFDRSLSRLGHGKGYYDRFLSSYITEGSRPRPLLVALALRQQFLDAGRVPVTERDWSVDIVVTPDEVITNSDTPTNPGEK